MAEGGGELQCQDPKTKLQLVKSSPWGCETQPVPTAHSYSCLPLASALAQVPAPPTCTATCWNT